MERSRIVGLIVVKYLTMLLALAVSIGGTHLVLHFLFNSKLVVSVVIHGVLMIIMLIYGKVKRLY
jgi:hypothetical protein